MHYFLPFLSFVFVIKILGEIRRAWRAKVWGNRDIVSGRIFVREFSVLDLGWALFDFLN